MIGIIVFDLLYEISAFCAILIESDQKYLTFIFIIITEIPINYSYISAFMISYLSWQ